MSEIQKIEDVLLSVKNRKQLKVALRYHDLAVKKYPTFERHFHTIKYLAVHIAMINEGFVMTDIDKAGRTKWRIKEDL